MAFSVKINNLGKITEKPIVVGGLTVLAGPNATGKTFFSKALYSVFDAMNANHTLVAIQGLARPLRQYLQILTRMPEFEKNTALDSIKAQFKQLERLCAPLSGTDDEIAAVEEMHPKLSGAVKEIVRAYGEVRPAIDKVKGIGIRENILDLSDSGIKDLKELTNLSSEEVVLKGFKRALGRNLRGNFQTARLTDLRGNSDEDTFIQIEGVGRIAIDGNHLQSDIEPAGLARLQKYSRVIYLESPIHWKLRGALKQYAPRFRHFGGSLNIPKYFTDLDAALNDEYSGEVAFPELLQELITDVLQGKMVIAESGELQFAENGQARPFSLPMTATGMVNLGILGMLIERKIIDKGAFLFIDEPEANLHPKWQAEMIRVLFELAQGGVHVVIATHSPDIAERLSALAKQNPGSEDMIALNHFSSEGVESNEKNFDKKMGAIIKELTDAFSTPT